MKKNVVIGIIVFVVLGVLYLGFDAVRDAQTVNGPVCGLIDVQCITTPCDPVEQTFLNRGEAEETKAYDIRDGACISDFPSCIAAGNPVMESYPRQCLDPVGGKTFVEVIEDAWRLDEIVLMRHEVDGTYGCFGCSVPTSDAPAMCVDPIMEMKSVEESSERYCDEEFNVVE